MATSDAQWYVDRCFSQETNKYYDIFFAVCRRFKVSWSEAGEKDRAFVEEVTRVEFERSIAREKGLPQSSVRPFFAE